MKKGKIVFLVTVGLTAALVLASCQQSDDSGDAAGSTSESSVYFAGSTCTDSSGTEHTLATPVIWNADGTVKYWLEGQTFYGGTANSVFVDGTNIYAGGRYCDSEDASIVYAIVWKNGEELYKIANNKSDDSYVSIYSIRVADGNVYALGESVDSFSSISSSDRVLADDYVHIKVWKNNEELFDLTDLDGVTSLTTSAIAVYNGDVYVAGSVSGETATMYSEIWKNGTELYSIGAADFITEILSMTVNSDGVYACGYKYSSDAEKNVACIWKDGTELYSVSETYNAYAIKLAVSSGDVYYTGNADSTADESGATYPAIWKNGSVLYDLAATGTETMYASTCCYANGNSYAGGYTVVDSKTYATIWKDGVRQVFTGSAGSAIESSFVSQ